jgi:hypothetical protein
VKRRFSIAAGLAGLVLAAGLPAAARSPLEGLWHGEIIYSPARIELEVIVEIAATSEGELVGTIDVPSQKMKYYPLSDASIDGTAASFGFVRDTEERQGVHFAFAGEMAAGGEAITGTFTGWYTDENDNQAPFHIRRIGEPGSERPEDRRGPLHELSDGCAELRQAFDASDHVRLVLLLSPT